MGSTPYLIFVNRRTPTTHIGRRRSLLLVLSGSNSGTAGGAAVTCGSSAVISFGTAVKRGDSAFICSCSFFSSLYSGGSPLHSKVPPLFPSRPPLNGRIPPLFVPTPSFSSLYSGGSAVTFESFAVISFGAAVKRGDSAFICSRSFFFFSLFWRVAVKFRNSAFISFRAAVKQGFSAFICSCSFFFFSIAASHRYSHSLKYSLRNFSSARAYT